MKVKKGKGGTESVGPDLLPPIAKSDFAAGYDEAVGGALI
jgi:hypothetical protein